MTTNETSNPGLVHAAGTSGGPLQLQQMPRATSYFVSNYVQGVPLTDGLIAGGEIVNVPHEGRTAEAYNQVFATSSDGGVCFGGLCKGMPEHHVATSNSVELANLFGDPLTKRKPWLPLPVGRTPTRRRGEPRGGATPTYRDSSLLGRR
jgi:hypothetical protein